MNLQQAVIYWIRLPEHDNVTTDGYLGVTYNFDLRMKEHRDNLARNKHKNPHLENAFKTYGWDYLVKEIIFSGEEAYCYEVKEQLRPKKSTGWNIASGGQRKLGWVKVKSRSPESILRIKEKNEIRRLESKEKSKLVRAERLDERIKSREEKLRLKEEKAKEKMQRIATNKEKTEKRSTERERRRLKRLKEGSLNPEQKPRPICKTCNKEVCAVNYIRSGKTYYRSQCDNCGRKKTKQQPRKSLWEKSGYKKKMKCDLCGFLSVLPSQITVYHIDGRLENTEFSNLRSICLNCVEVVKKKELHWRRGDLEVDY